jgi:hypothetical protein
VYHDVAVFIDGTRVSGDAAVGVIECFTGNDVELPAVPGAAKHAAGEIRAKLKQGAGPMGGMDGPLAKRSALVWTDILEGKVLPADIEDTDFNTGFRISYDTPFAGRQLGSGTYYECSSMAGPGRLSSIDDAKRPVQGAMLR